MALDGRLCLSLKPKNFSKEKEFWQTHPETKALDDIVHNVEQTALANFNPKYIQNDENNDDDDDDDNEEDDHHNFERKILTSDENQEETSDDQKSSKSLHLTNPYSIFTKDDLEDD